MDCKLNINEKLWFGKYKNKRLRDIILNNPSYINILLYEYNIKDNDTF